jgi:hypothetical protein
VNACFIDLATVSTIYTCNKLSSEGSYNCLLPNWESVILRVVVMDIGRHGSRASLRAQSENSTRPPHSLAGAVQIENSTRPLILCLVL